MSGLEVVREGQALVFAAAGVGLLALLAWARESWRPREGRGWRLALTFVALAALSVLFAGLSALQAAGGGRQAILWTAGANEDLVPRDWPEGLPVYALQGTVAGAPRQARWVADTVALTRAAPDVSRWRVVGEGLREWEWESVSAPVESVAAAPAGFGMVRAGWTRRLQLGGELIVTGKLRSELERVTVRLVGPGGEADRAEPAADGIFELRTRPRRGGRYLYGLRWGPAEGPEEAELLDVEVTPREPLRVLWLEGAPAFETRHFKSWFAGAGGELTIRTAVSRDRWRTEFFNRRQAMLRRLDASALDGLDLLVADAAALRGLSPSERRALAQSVDAGLGLLVRDVGSRLPRTPMLTGFELAEVAGVGELEVRLRLPGGGDPQRLAVGAREVVASPGLRPLLADSAGRLMAALRTVGAGRVAVSLVDDSYRWVLRGAASTHRELWVTLLEAVARRREVSSWSIASGPLWVDEPLALALRGDGRGAGARIRTPNGGAVALPLRQDATDPASWTAVFRPLVTGWHRAEAGEVGQWFYVQPPEGWGTLRRQRSLDDTARRAASARGGEDEWGTEATRRLPVPAWPAFVIFVVAVGALWIGERSGAP